VLLLQRQLLTQPAYRCRKVEALKAKLRQKSQFREKLML
jgi:hypothetical protein